MKTALIIVSVFALLCVGFFILTFISMSKFRRKGKGIDPNWDPDEMNRTRWFVIVIPFEWIVKAWRKLFG